jgi:hypothetical protein
MPPDPGRYRVKVGDNLAPLSVAAYVDPGTSPVLASQPSITITGQGFVAGVTEIFVGAIPVPASQISVSPAGTSLTFTTPSGATDAVSPISVRVNGIESDPALWATL